MDTIIVLAAVASIVGVRVWAGVALAQFIAGLPADHQGRWRRALSRSEL